MLPYYAHPVLSLVFLPAMLEWIYALDWWIRQHPLSEVPGRLFLFANLPTLQDHPDLTFPNDFHPTPAGVDRMARDLAPLVARVLENRDAWRGAPGSGPLSESFRRDCLGRRAGGGDP